MGTNLTLMISRWKRHGPDEIDLISDQLSFDRDPLFFRDKIKPKAHIASPAQIEIEHEDGEMETIIEDSQGEPLTFISPNDCAELASQANSIHNVLALLYASTFRQGCGGTKIYLYWH